MNTKLVLIACLFFVAAVYADRDDDIPEELEEFRDIEEPTEDREDEEANPLMENDDDEDLKKEELKMAAVKAGVSYDFQAAQNAIRLYIIVT